MEGMRILMAGASGFLGGWLGRWLTDAGHDVVRLVRRAPRDPDEREWRPSEGRLDPAAVAEADAVVNLAGAGIGDHRWTARYKAVLLSSRVDTTRTLATTIAALPAADRPHVLLSMSGISCYGDTRGRTVTEEAPLGDGFLPSVCRAWESATGPAADAGVRVVLLRTAPVLHRDGGLLKPQLLPFRLGIAGKLGDGRQWTPWIELSDWLAAATYALDRPEVSGPVNVVSPTPITNAEFTKAFGRALRRPTVMPIPAFALRVALGEFSVELLSGSGALPGVLTRTGFTFRYPDIDAALRVALREDPAFSQAR
jgi:uncharacterized protein (TIGR01777 family)